MLYDSQSPGEGERFRLGINYWPARTAMGWWTDFDAAEVRADFDRIAGAGFDSARVFLTWEDFQPTPTSVQTAMLDRLVVVADLAEQAGLDLMPTLFTGHMSGVNWIPSWALGGSDGDRRFRVMSGGSIVDSGLRNWYTSAEVGAAQALLAKEAAAALAGHASLWAWDLGNENSNCVTPPSRSAAGDWLKRVTASIRTSDPAAHVTIGLHMEDLEEDRRLGPVDAAAECDFLTMHGYPIYARWSKGPTDEHLLPFLALMTKWLGSDQGVLFSEFGLPTYRQADPVGQSMRDTSSFLLVEEQRAARYTERALSALVEAGCLGAMLWCYSDYDPAIWQKPPLDVATHERSFGLWRADNSPKPSVNVVKRFSGADRGPVPGGYAWIDIEAEEFWTDSANHISRLYGRYRDYEGLTS